MVFGLRQVKENLRFHDNKWDIFGKKELNSNARSTSAFDNVYNLGFTKDKTIFIGTNLGVYQWKSGKMMPVMADPPQPFIVHEADTLSGNTVLFSTNNGIYQWNAGEWSQITSKFFLKRIFLTGPNLSMVFISLYSKMPRVPFIRIRR